MTSVWVVMEAGWEYDDNTYEIGGGGLAIKVYSSKERAEDRAKALILRRTKDLMLCGELSDYIPWGDAQRQRLCEIFQGRGFVEIRALESHELAAWSDSDILECASCLDQPFYEVCEVEYE